MKNIYHAVALGLAALSFAGFASSARAETVLHSFTGGSDGAPPISGLIADAQGALYGTTHSGGLHNVGTVFKLTPPTPSHPAWTETILHSFAGGSDGSWPLGSLIADSTGALYGTTSGDASGADCSSGTKQCGTVFKLTPPAPGHTLWTETVLYAFSTAYNNTLGSWPVAGLIADKHGALYGTTRYGGLGGFGTVFKLTPPAPGESFWTPIELYSFRGFGDGTFPVASLIFDPVDEQGALYGTTSRGGKGLGCNDPEGCGTVFKLTPPDPGYNPAENWTETVLYHFCSQPNCRDGHEPVSGLMADPKGRLYGTTRHGGVSDSGNFGSGFGTIFMLTPAAKGEPFWPETVLYAFCPESGCLDGVNPVAGLIADQQGVLYGTTARGGAGFSLLGGTAFKLTPPAPGQTLWTETVLHNFCSQTQDCLDGADPEAGLIADQHGVLYGTTSMGGSNGTEGTVFKLPKVPE
jgi:uncharacterized repeat protein (TIGR03803 family)